MPASAVVDGGAHRVRRERDKRRGGHRLGESTAPVSAPHSWRMARSTRACGLPNLVVRGKSTTAMVIKGGAKNRSAITESSKMNWLKTAAKSVFPASLRALVRGTFGWRWFDGDYPSWSAALADSKGYEDPVIIKKVAESTRAVREGRAAFERDGVSFPEASDEKGLLEALRTVADSIDPQSWNVVDFGGALGTTYWRHRLKIERLRIERWDVVEQPLFVAAGLAQRVAGDKLDFFETVRAAQGASQHTMLLASGLLQYLEDPFSELREWMDEGFAWLIINNLPLHLRAPDRIALQRVPPEIYRASYPVRFFNRERFLACFEGRYDIVAEFASEAVWLVDRRNYPSTGLLLRKKIAG